MVTFVFNASGSIFYDPETWSLGYSSIGERWHFHSGLDFERWDGFDGTIMKIQFEQLAGSLKQYPVNTGHHNILVPRI